MRKPDSTHAADDTVLAPPRSARVRTGPFADTGRGISRRTFFRGTGATAIAIGLPAGLVACGGSADEEGGGSLSHLTFNMHELPERYDTTRMALQHGSSMLLALEPLLLLDAETGDVQPHLCSLETPDPVTYRFTVRDGVKFWDGSPLTTEDVKFSMEIHRDEANGSLYAWAWANTKSIEITGDREITVTLDKPQVNFHTGVTQIGVVKRDFWQEHGQRTGTPNVLNVGTGPYKVTRFEPSKTVELERNESYWGPKPKVARLTLTNVTDVNTALAAVQSSQLTGNFNIPRQQLAQYREMDGVKVYTAPGADYTALAFDVTKAPFDDIHVRRAIAHCIDTKGIISSVYQDAATPATTMIAPPLLKRVMSTDEIAALQDRLHIPYDLDKARDELAQSSHPDGFSHQVLTNSSEPELKQVALILQANLKKIGIQLSIKEVEGTEYNHKIWFDVPHKQGMSLANAGYFAWTPFSQLQILMTPTGLPPLGYANLANLKSDELTSLWKAMNQLTDLTEPDQRKKAASIVTRLLEINHENVAYPGIVFRDEVLVMDDRYTYDGFAGSWLLGYWWRKVSIAG